MGERSEGSRRPEAAARLVEQDLRNLESRIEELIHICDRLREENTLLRNQQIGLLAERAQLIKKTEVISSRVESMILRFKSMEYDA